jgi:hypothetical protein
MAGFWNSFQNYRRISKQLLETQVAIKSKPEQALGKGLLGGFSLLVSDLEATRNFILDFLHKKTN